MNEDVEKLVNSFFQKYPQRKFVKQDVLIRPDYDPSGIYYIEEGQIRQYDISDSGQRVYVNIYKTGAFFPMSWAITDLKNEYFFEVFTESKLRLASKEAVIDFIYHNPEVMYDLLNRVFRGTDGVIRRMFHLMASSAQTRIIFELIVENKRRSKDGHTQPFDLSESDLALRTGLARETVNRELRKLKQASLVNISQKGIAVNDLLGLEEAYENSRRKIS